MTARSEKRSVLSSAVIEFEVLVLSGGAVAVVVVGFAVGTQCIAVAGVDFGNLAAGPAVDIPCTAAVKVRCQSQWAVVQVHRVAAGLAGSWNMMVAHIEIGLDEHYYRHRGKSWSWNTSLAQLPANKKRLNQYNNNEVTRPLESSEDTGQGFFL